MEKKVKKCDNYIWKRAGGLNFLMQVELKDNQNKVSLRHPQNPAGKNNKNNKEETLCRFSWEAQGVQVA